MGLLGRLRRSVSNRKKPPEERFPDEPFLKVGEEGDMPVKKKRKPDSRRDRRRVQLEGSGTRAEKKMKRRSRRKGRRIRKVMKKP